MLSISPESIIKLAGMTISEFEDILIWLEKIKIYQKELELFRKAIEQNVNDFAKNPLTQREAVIARANEITLLVIQMLATAVPEDNFRDLLEKELKESLQPKGQEQQKYMVKSIAEAVQENVKTYVDEKITRVKDLIINMDSTLCTRVHGVFEAHTQMSLSQFSERWLKYRTGHEMRVS